MKVSHRPWVRATPFPRQVGPILSKLDVTSLFELTFKAAQRQFSFKIFMEVFFFPLPLSLSSPSFFLIWYGRLHKWLTIPVSCAYITHTHTHTLVVFTASENSWLAGWRRWLPYRAEHEFSSFAVDEVIKSLQSFCCCFIFCFKTMHW